jgi:putative FmdB family regulatory protein
MPIYEYSCDRCGKTIEVIQKMSDRPLRKHADCGGKLTKLVSAAGFQFKGSGWYVTDYARKSSGEGKESSKGEGKESSKDSPKDSKPAANGGKESGDTTKKADSKKSGS